MIIIAEKINGTRKSVAEAIRQRDAAFIQELARVQSEAGSQYLDINAGTSPDREPEDMAWLVKIVQEVSDLPLSLDSANPQALAAALELVERTPIINSVSGEKPRVEGVLPLALKYNTNLILMALDDTVGIPADAEGRLAVVDRLAGLAQAGGLAQGQLFVDPLVTAVSTGTDSALVTFETIRRVRAAYPEAHVTCGLSNISFGLPLRPLVNQTFLAMAVAAGLDSAIINPNDRQLMGVMLAAEMLAGRDRYCQNFGRAYRAGSIGPVNA